MGIFDIFKPNNINEAIEEFSNTPGAVLIDVRSPQEYRSGHIPESVNIPVHNIDKVVSFVKDKETALFVYCYSGARSRQAVSVLKQLGYSNAKNIGGITAYSGKVKS